MNPNAGEAESCLGCMVVIFSALFSLLLFVAAIRWLLTGTI